MTSSYRGLYRRSNGSIVIRSTSYACSCPAESVTGPIRRSNVSKAAGQSSSVPSNSPIKCFSMPASSSVVSKAWQVVGKLSPPPWPIVRYVETPQVYLMGDAFVGEQPAKSFGAYQRTSGVLPHSLPAHQDQEHL